MSQPNSTGIMSAGMSAATNPVQTHSHNLSINSISSITEPTTPPAVSGGAKLYLWESAKLNGTLALPTFNLDSHATDLHHIKEFPIEPDQLEKDITQSLELAIPITAPVKIDKEYLASVGKTPLAQLKNQIFRLAKDQHGCRFLQKRIDENVVTNAHARAANFEIIFEQVSPLLYELIIDPFGNYLIQKLTDYCDESNLNLFLETLQFNLFLISINQHGTRALQKVIDRMNNNYQLSLLIKGLKPYIIDLIKDLNGNHVIQKILNKYTPENCQFIYDSINEDLLTVATHKHGCCVLQKCLNHVNLVQLIEFSSNILKYEIFIKLVNDQFGNYVLQYLISIDSIEVNRKLYNNFAHFGTSDLCKLKFSSNVIEKLMRSCYKNEPKSIEFSNLKFSLSLHILSSDLNKLVNDPYGNYVVQTLLDTLMNLGVTYLFDLPRGGQILLPSLQMLLPEDFQTNFDSLQIQVIKKWFRNCKIVSSFGRRIQLKINILLSGVSKLQRKSVPSRYGNDIPFASMPPSQSMNANGEFISSNGLNNIKSLSNPSMSLEKSAQFQSNQYSRFNQLYYPRQSYDPISYQHQTNVSVDYQQSQLGYQGYSLTPNNYTNGEFTPAPRNFLINGNYSESRNSNSISCPAQLHARKQFVSMDHSNVPYADYNRSVFKYNPNQPLGEPVNFGRRFTPHSVPGNIEPHFLPNKQSQGNDRMELVQQSPLAFNGHARAQDLAPEFRFGNSNSYNLAHPNTYNQTGGKGQYLR